MGPKIKDKGNGAYITFKRKELKKDGSPNQPIRVVDSSGNNWNPKTKIGNGSTVNVNFALNEYKPKDFNANILSLQVWDLVVYEGGEFPTKDAVTGEDWSEQEEVSE